MAYNEPDYDSLCWHGCRIWALQFCCGDFLAGDWTSDLVLDIDYIVDWICGEDRKMKFQVAPATLAFHSVTDLMININWSDSGFQNSLYPVAIEDIERERIQDQKVCLDRPYYMWRIRLNSPQEGEIIFGASGFTQTLRAEATLSCNQHLSSRERKPFTVYP